MFFRRKEARDEIPTLHDLVEDGTAASQAAPATNAPAPDDPPAAPSPVATADPQPLARSAFEATIETMVDEILNRHMRSAREEIARSVLSEVRARLRRDNGGKTGKD